jgi:hypothetical protein
MFLLLPLLLLLLQRHCRHRLPLRAQYQTPGRATDDYSSDANHDDARTTTRCPLPRAVRLRAQLGH